MRINNDIDSRCALCDCILNDPKGRDLHSMFLE